MSTPWALLAFGLVMLLLSANLFWPLRRPSPIAPVSFFAGWLTGELAVHMMVLSLGVGVALMAAGALEAWPGWLGLAALGGGVYGLQRAYAEAERAGDDMAAALREAFGQDAPEAKEPFDLPRFSDLVRPFSPHRSDVVKVKDVPYASEHGRRGMLDIFYGADWGCSPLPDVSGTPAERPVFVYVHGGAWAISKKEHQGLPLLNLLASRGWICVSINYRLSPQATFPDHLIDVKRALAWTKDNIARYGGDPDFIVISGGSAGGHLAALAALTSNDRGYQPGFEDKDTSVQGCVALYSVFDLLDRHEHWPHPWMTVWMERLVIKQKVKDAPMLFEAASPVEQLEPGAPPFLVIHGDRDSMVPPAESEAFVKAYREIVGDGVALAKVSGAQHAFDVFTSRRTVLVNQAIARYVDGLWQRSEPRMKLVTTPRLTLVRSNTDQLGLGGRKTLEAGRGRR